MHLRYVVTGKRWAILIVCLMLLFTFLPNVHETSATEDNADIKEPSQLYFFGSPPDGLGNDSFMVAWNQTKQLDEMLRFSALGNYSVLIYCHIYEGHSTGKSCEPYVVDFALFVLASTLQSDNEGLIHQLIVTFHMTYSSDFESASVIDESCVQQTYGLNLTSEESAKRILERFSEDWLAYGSNVEYPPFLVFQCSFNFSSPANSDSGTYVTVILNQFTGKIMIAAAQLYYDGGLPAYLNNDAFYIAPWRSYLWPNPTIDPQSPIRVVKVEMDVASFHFGDSASGSLLVVVKNIGLSLTVENVSVEERYTGDPPVNDTDPPLPVTIPSGSELALNISTSVSVSKTYIVRIRTSIGLSFKCCVFIGGPFISSVTFDFVRPRVPGTGKKININVRNTGKDNQIVGLYIGTSPSTLQDQNIAMKNLTQGRVIRITVDHNWTEGLTYYFRAVFSFDPPYDYSVQAPPVGWRDPKDGMILFRIEPENMNVREGDVFNVSVRIENLPVDPLLAMCVITWDPAVLEAVDMREVLFHEVTPQNEWDNIYIFQLKINNTEGSAFYHCLWRDCQRALDEGYAPIRGNHTLTTITMKAVGTGSTVMYFSSARIGAYGSPFLIDGNVYVQARKSEAIPEFSFAGVLVLLMLLTLSIAMLRSRKLRQWIGAQ